MSISTSNKTHTQISTNYKQTKQESVRNPITGYQGIKDKPQFPTTTPLTLMQSHASITQASVIIKIWKVKLRSGGLICHTLGIGGLGSRYVTR